MLVEKRVAVIIRWLERLKKSYSSGALESALMDAECARADLENLRLAVWEKVKPAQSPRAKFFARVMNVFKPLILACVIVMVYVVPIAKDVQYKSLNYKPEEILTINENKQQQKSSLAAQKTITQMPIAQTAKKSDVQAKATAKFSNTQTKTLETQTKTIAKNLNAQAQTLDAQAKTLTKTSGAAKRSALIKQPVKEEVVQVQAENKSVAYDKVFSLIQTGQKALKNNNSVIKVK